MHGKPRHGLLLAIILQCSLACSNDTPTATETVAPEDISSIALADEAQAPGTSNEDLPGSLTEDTGTSSADPAAAPDATADAPAADTESYEDAFAEMPIPDNSAEASPQPKPSQKRASEAGPRPKRASKKLIRYVSATMLNVRSKPSPRAKIVRQLLGGTKLSVELHGKYAKIKNGQWCSSRYLSATPTRKVSRAEAEQAWGKKSTSAPAADEQSPQKNQ